VKRQWAAATKLAEESEAHLGFVNSDNRDDRHDAAKAQIYLERFDNQFLDVEGERPDGSPHLHRRD
jgi:hypothetical protein